MNTAPVDHPAPPPQPPADDEARALAVLLRSSRLTLLRCAAGAARSALLRDGLLPLLHRRASDTPATRHPRSAVVLPFPDRRSAAAPSRPAPIELALLLDQWQAPLASLHTQLAAALGCPLAEVVAAGATLGARLQVLGERCHARWLIVADGFDTVLRGSAANDAAGGDSDAERQRFVDELGEALRDPAVPAQWLLAVSDDADALLQRFRRQFPGLAEPPRRLSHWDLSPPTIETRVEPDPAADDPAWILSIDRILERVAERARHAGPAAADDDPTLPFVFSGSADTPPAPVDLAIEPPAVETPLPRLPPLAPSEPLPRAAAIAPAAEPAAIIPPQVTRRMPYRSLAAAAAFAAVLLWLAWPASTPPPPLAALPKAAPLPAPRPAPAAVPAPLPSAVPVTTLALAVDSEDGSALVTELNRFVAPGAGLVLRAEPRADGAEGLVTPGFSLLRYDALQALRRSRPNLPLRLVAPLLPEVVHVAVRADSPLRAVHEIETARLNVGPADGSRALTASAVYQQLFAHALPAAQASHASRDAGLRELLDTRSVDVLVWVDSAPSAWLAALPAARAAGLRLLPLAPTHPASQRALRSYLPATLPGATAGESMPALAVMGFLAAVGSSSAADPAAARLMPALCAALPALRRDGQPAWRTAQPGLRLPAGWPYTGSAAIGSDACALPPPPALKGASS